MMECGVKKNPKKQNLDRDQEDLHMEGNVSKNIRGWCFRKAVPVSYHMIGGQKMARCDAWVLWPPPGYSSRTAPRPSLWQCFCSLVRVSARRSLMSVPSPTWGTLSCPSKQYLIDWLLDFQRSLKLSYPLYPVYSKSSFSYAVSEVAVTRFAGTTWNGGLGLVDFGI